MISTRWQYIADVFRSSSRALLVIGIIVTIPPLLADDAPKAADPKTAPTAKAAADDYGTRIIVTNADGSDPKDLTVLPAYSMQGSPEWSTDGKLVCFDVWKTDGSVSTGEIVVVNSDGTNPRVVSDGLMPSFSPKGHSIAFSRSRNGGGIWVMNISGDDKTYEQIDRNGWGCSWAPDGRLVYALRTKTGANLVIVDFVEGTRTNVFDTDTPYRSIYWNLAWSPDSQRIVFKAVTEAGPEVIIVDARGEKFGLDRRPSLKEMHESYTWTPDGLRILSAKLCPEREGRWQIYSINALKDEPPQLLEGQDAFRHAITAACSPDGRKLALSCRKPTPPPAAAAKAP